LDDLSDLGGSSGGSGWIFPVAPALKRVITVVGCLEMEAAKSVVTSEVSAGRTEEVRDGERSLSRGGRMGVAAVA
jgi:hypothetical protein